MEGLRERVRERDSERNRDLVKERLSDGENWEKVTEAINENKIS